MREKCCENNIFQRYLLQYFNQDQTHPHIIHFNDMFNNIYGIFGLPELCGSI